MDLDWDDPLLPTINTDRESEALEMPPLTDEMEWGPDEESKWEDDDDEQGTNWVDEDEGVADGGIHFTSKMDVDGRGFNADEPELEKKTSQESGVLRSRITDFFKVETKEEAADWIGQDWEKLNERIENDAAEKNIANQ